MHWHYVFQLADNLMLFHGLVSNKLFDNMQISRFIIFFLPSPKDIQSEGKTIFFLIQKRAEIEIVKNGANCLLCFNVIV